MAYNKVILTAVVLAPVCVIPLLLVQYASNNRNVPPVASLLPAAQVAPDDLRMLTLGSSSDEVTDALAPHRLYTPGDLKNSDQPSVHTKVNQMISAARIKALFDYGTNDCKFPAKLDFNELLLNNGIYPSDIMYKAYRPYADQVKRDLVNDPRDINCDKVIKILGPDGALNLIGS